MGKVRWQIFIDELEKVEVDLPRSKSLHWAPVLSHLTFLPFDCNAQEGFSKEN